MIDANHVTAHRTRVGDRGGTGSPSEVLAATGEMPTPVTPKGRGGSDTARCGVQLVVMMQVDRLFGWSIGLLAVWLVGWAVGSSIGWSVV